MIYGYKIIRFLSRVGLPPFKQSRDLLRKKREGRLDSEEYSRRNVMGLISGRARVNAPEVEEAERIEAGLPGEDDTEESGQEGLLLDSLATREDTLSVAARDLLLSDDDIDVVVFGHDHRYYSNELRPVVQGKRGKYYVNTGTWIPMLFLTRTRRKLRWKDLLDQSLYQQLLTYVVVKKGLSGTAASLKRFHQVDNGPRAMNATSVSGF